jgi:uncharacterized small protein (DUF1192 family)
MSSNAKQGPALRNLLNQPVCGWQPFEPEEAGMASDDEDRPRKAPSHEIGQDLSLLSVEELTGRIVLLQGEIERLEQAVGRKRASRDAADNIFKS